MRHAFDGECLCDDGVTGRVKKEEGSFAKGAQDDGIFIFCSERLGLT